MSRSGAFIRVSCDKCFTDTEVELCALAGRGAWDERHVNAELSRDGWSHTSNGEDFCSGCTDDEREEAQ